MAPQRAPLSGMTGFATAQASVGRWSFTVEARSVNARSGLDVKTRAPPGLDGLDTVIRDQAMQRFQRGSLQLSVQVRTTTSGERLRINEAVLRQVLDAIAPLVASGVAAAPTADGLLAVRGVLEATAEEDSPDAIAERDAGLRAAIGQALDGLKEARLAEGAVLAAALCAILDDAAAAAARARALAGAQSAAIRNRLSERMSELLAGAPVDETRIVQEAAAAALKADVREELDRLDAHLIDARALIHGGGSVGRRLEFLAQELNREANTLGAKSASLELTRAGLALKAAIDQFKEQCLNVE